MAWNFYSQVQTKSCWLFSLNCSLYIVYYILLNFVRGKRSIVATLPHNNGLGSNCFGHGFALSILVGETQLIKCAEKHNQREEKAENCTRKMLALRSNYINYNACNLCFTLTLVQKLKSFFFDFFPAMHFIIFLYFI